MYNQHNYGDNSSLKKDVYVDSLPSSFTDQDFRELFSGYQTTSLNFKKHKTGTQTGYGFVSMESEEEAQRAMKELNGKQVRDQTIRVLPSAKTESSKTNIYIEGLPENWNEQTLKKNYEQFGEITNVKILIDKITNQRNGVAFVHFKDAASSTKAITETNGTTPDGSSRALAVRYARINKKKNEPGYLYGGFGWGMPRGRGAFRGRGRGGRGRRGRGYGPYGAAFGYGWGGPPGWGAPAAPWQQQWGGYQPYQPY